MIFQRSILREKITVAAVILLTLLIITSVLFLVRGLREASAGNVAIENVLQFILITTLSYFPLIVVVTVMVATTMTVSRLYRDSEMAVWQSSGLSWLNLLRPVAMMVLPMFVFLLFLNTILTPWTSRQLTEYRSRSNIQELGLIKEGTFHSADSGRRVFFVDEIEGSGQVPNFKNIFAVQKNDQGVTLVTAQKADLENGFDNRAFMVLKNGYQYDDKTAEHIFQSMYYSRYGFSLDEFTKVSTQDVRNLPVEQRATNVLWRATEPNAQAELYRRASDSFMIVPMALFAIVLGYVKPRGARTWGIIAGLLVFLIYLNMIKAGESAIGRGQWSLITAVLIVHVGCLCVALMALCYRYYSWRQLGFHFLGRRGS